MDQLDPVLESQMWSLEEAVVSSSSPHFESGLGQLSERIWDVLSRFDSKVLLRDDSVTLNGSVIRQKIKSLENVIEGLVPQRGRVGILFENSAAKAFSILAVMALGRVPVILNPTDSQETVESLLEKMRLHTLLIGEDLFQELQAQSSVVRMSQQAQVLSVQTNGISVVPPLPRIGTALILYTSGSMGEPKGVEISERGLLYTVDFLVPYFGLNSKTVAPVILPICHSMAMNTQFLPAFLVGAECIFFESAYSLNRVYRNILESKGDFVALIGEILRLCWEERRKRNLPPAMDVKHIQLAGGMIRAEHLEMARELFPNAVVHKGYGLTEGIRVSMINSLDPNFLTDNAGYVLPGQEIEVRSSSGKVLPPGVVGHLFVRGPNVMLGYDNLPEWPQGLMGADGFMKTGDMGFITIDARLVIHGRSDSIFKVQGKRVSAKEIEKAALASSSWVRDVKVLPMIDEKVGARPVLFLEVSAEKENRFLNGGTQEFEKKLKEGLSNKLSIPKDVFILQSFPRTYNGKLKSQVLREVWSQREKTAPVGAGGATLSFRVVSPSTIKMMS